MGCSCILSLPRFNVFFSIYILVSGNRLHGCHLLDKKFMISVSFKFPRNQFLLRLLITLESSDPKWLKGNHNNIYFEKIPKDIWSIIPDFKNLPVYYPIVHIQGRIGVTGWSWTLNGQLPFLMSMWSLHIFIFIF